ncbi:unnamed protein product [Pieris macdunnoughi]|uniref:Peptidase M14 domain-containing protein n=1 Tax=Pieris macdunnoughi TaxID=345717 RepID=A0A821NKX3_9NEOP|nr:unnamed protein product [Pieris macdunnoughi]
MNALVDDLEHASIYRKGPDDSEESDGEGGLGNLNRLIVRPPGHSGKAKRGHLCFDAAYECGNLGRADHITELEYDLFIRPDTCRPRSRFWFNFTVENVKQDQRVIFNIVNLGKEFTLYNCEMTPLVRSTSRQKWQRIPRRLLFYHRSIVHRGRKILSFAFGNILVYGKRKRRSLLKGSQLHRLHKNTKKRVVLLLARSHGGEPPSSYICQGFLDFLVSSSEKAVALRNEIVIQVVPMLNPDGVFLGNHRSDLLGSDLNRCWNTATSFAHPALIAVNDHIKKITAEKGLQLDFIIDLHADVSHEGVFVRGNSYDDVYRFERHAVLPKFMAMRVEAWQCESCLYNTDALSLGSARRSLPMGAVDAYTLLASMGGRRITPRGPYLHYTEDAYTKIGRSLAKALCDYYRHIAVIPPRMGATSKKKEPRGRRHRKRPAYERKRSPSSSPERRVLATRMLSPSLPIASPLLKALPPRTARNPSIRTRPKTVNMENTLPMIQGTAVRTPRLAVVDLSAYIRTPTCRDPRYRQRLARPPRPTHPRFTSDEYDTHESTE